MKMIIKYPVLMVDFKEVEMSDEDVLTLENCTEGQKADIIEKHLPDDEMGHVPGRIVDALEYGYADIIFPPETKST